MKYLEVSKKISTSRDMDNSEVKSLLIDRLERIIDVESVSDNPEKFEVFGTTGTPSSLSRHSKISLDVHVIKEDRTHKILISGNTRVALSLVVSYMILVVLVLVIGLLPGSIESGENSGPGDAIVFLIIGAGIIFDIRSKLAEPKEMLEDVLQSLDTALG